MILLLIIVYLGTSIFSGWLPLVTSDYSIHQPNSIEFLSFRIVNLVLNETMERKRDDLCSASLSLLFVVTWNENRIVEQLMLNQNSSLHFVYATAKSGFANSFRGLRGLIILSLVLNASISSGSDCSSSM